MNMCHYYGSLKLNFGIARSNEDVYISSQIHKCFDCFTKWLKEENGFCVCQKKVIRSPCVPLKYVYKL